MARPRAHTHAYVPYRRNLPILPSTTLPPSEPEVVLEAPPAVRAAEEHAGQCGHDPSAHGGQAPRGGGGGAAPAAGGRGAGGRRGHGAPPPFFSPPRADRRGGRGGGSRHRSAWWCSPRQ